MRLQTTIDLLTSYHTPKKMCAMGNIAIARGAIERGVSGVFAYPGTPSTEISEVFSYINAFQSKLEHNEKFPEQTKDKIYFEYSINEKIAMEKAIAFSIGNKSALCVMKNAGMNVASDALMNITYQTIVAPLVIVVCDDPGGFSSSNEQDSRYWGKMASVPLLNPATPSDAYAMTKQAFTISEKLQLPVIVRTTTRVSHSRGIFFYNNIQTKKSIASFERSAKHISIPIRTVSAHKQLLEKMHRDNFHDFYSANNSAYHQNGNNIAIISSGVAVNYVQEILSTYNNAKISMLRLGLIYPFPEDDVLNFIKNDFEKILVLEELEPLIENEVCALAQKNKITSQILGKGFAGLARTGEFTLDIVRDAMETFAETSTERNKTKIAGTEKFLSSIPSRPPALCAGCPHRATFYALKLAVPRENGKIVLCGDIGCLALGALPPLQMMDTVHHMGMSVSLAQGLAEAFRLENSNNRVVTLVGDGTFFHSGVASLLNAVYTRSNITLIIFDNRTIAMTGHQAHPGAIHDSKYQQINIQKFIRAMGVEYVETVNPFDLKDTFKKIQEAIVQQGVSVVIATSPCIFLPEFQENLSKNLQAQKTLRVNQEKCNTCFNHCDLQIFCSKEGTPQNSIARARAKIVAKIHIPAAEQLCPANICNHGFFNSILAGNHKEALEIVRDKMLFARLCGDICHRPCEDSEREHNLQRVPIKRLKNYVSNIEDNFVDFSRQISKAQRVSKINKTVAIIGAGPAGLSVAYDLLQAGYDVTVFEKEANAGGMIRYAIPDFRMDKKALQKEIDVLCKMGVVFHFNITLGKDITIEKLSDTFHAVVIAIGMWRAAKLGIVESNVSSERQFDAVSFLKKFNGKNLDLKPASTVLVIGGGNSAMDAARAAKLFNTNNEVIISYIEKADSMPAFTDELNDTLKREIKIIDNSFVDAVVEKNEKLFISLHAYDDKRFIDLIEADYIIYAIGQKGDRLALDNRIVADENNRIKSADYANVFIAGDIAANNHISLIGAIGSGKKAAVKVRKLIEGYNYDYEGEYALSRLNTSKNVKTHVPLPKNERNEFSNADVLENISSWDLYQPCEKCNHCIENFGCPALIKVNGKVMIDESKCTLCGLCVDVCPNNAIEWVDKITETKQPS